MDRQQAQQLIRETFEQPFDKGRFSRIVRNILNKIEDAPFTYQGNYIPEKFRQYIKTLERIGKYSDGEHTLDILIITLQKETSLDRARTMQRNFIAWYLNGSRPGGGLKDAALVAYVSPDQADWRFSLVKMDYKFEKTETGKIKVKEEFTPARRWSFLVGVNEKSHTAQSRLVKILADDEHAPTLADLEKAFDIETVTKEFFLKYRELFLLTKEALDKVVENDPKVKADFDAKGVDTVNFAKKLLGQIVFLYFLQKKGWFGVGRDDDWGTGSKHFLRGLFEKAHGDYTNFFNDILEPLFYEALRIDRSHDDDYYSRFNCKIPFLNGGLFDPIGNYDWVHTDIHLSNDLFSNSRNTNEGDEGDGILDVFDRYNFTVREDEPLEKEVAIDPELLGKAYEKFNAIRPDNFDEFTKALKSGKKGEENKFNKKFGVYYTPREIVHYMCKQSLINYLHTKVTQAFLPVEITRQDIEDLIEVGEMITEHEATALIKEQNIKNGIQKSTEYTALLSDGIRNNAKIIDDWLADITVCDPAAGSGAFPVGMMNEIVRARNVLSVFLKSNTDIPVCDSDSDSIHKTHRNLPHWTKAGAIYWVTFRLADSLPQEKLNPWKVERDRWISLHPEPWSDEEWEEYNERFGETLEKWLDAGYGSCVLSKLEQRKIVEDCLLRFDGERLQVHAAVIMPNHVHLLIEPLADNILSELLKGIKGASARQINQLSGKTGTKFWMDESYDHIVRNERQYHHFIKYIVDNPAKARLAQDKYWLYQCSTGILVKGNTDIPDCEKTAKTQTGMSVPRSSYEFKRRCIEHSLYGVDIDPGAVEIAKLRLWLSLVVDEEDIKNIKPLPNLDYKIVCGNSLLGVEKDLFNHQLFDELEKLKPLFFSETNPTKKKQYKKQIDQLISQITNGHKEFDFEVYFSEVFHDKGGFDVVIANPPYLESRHPDFTDEFKKMYQAATKRRWGEDAKYVTRGSDMLIYFFENAIFNINQQGCIVLITQNSWLDTEYGKKFQKFLLNNTQVRLIVDSDFRYFSSDDGPNINAVITVFWGRCTKPSNVITFARYHESFESTSNLTNPEDSPFVDISKYSYTNTLLQDMKWGFLLASSKEILEIFDLLRNKALKVEDVKGCKLKFGQGLNLSKNYLINSNTLSLFPFAKKAAIPILTSDDGAVFNIQKTSQYIVDKAKLTKKEIQEIKGQGINLFHSNSTSKTPPKLIMPRGISKHFCAFNPLSCYSSSGVDLYDVTNNATDEILLNIWLFFNSSLFWLLREISGRKNLGGGMLKSEAVDLINMPVFMDFQNPKGVLKVLEKLSNRHALNTVDEIDTNEHKKIDKIVFDYLNLKESERNNVISILKQKITDREKKASI